MNARRNALAFSLLLTAAFSAEPGTRILLNIEPTAENPRNSEGGFVTLNSGRILFDYSQFYGGHRDEPGPDRGNHLRRSGDTWSALGSWSTMARTKM